MRKKKSLLPALLDWFAENARDLPWRHTRDPYAIWVSEIMLQQTQVKTVIPYWQRWMAELPAIAALAKASPERVLKLWEGLGYYTRARNLQAAAQLIMAEHGGRFPRELPQVLALPGVGRYTAGAICSIAFNQPAPILDGNVVRLLTRLFGIQENPRQPTANAQLWTLAEQLVGGVAKSRDDGNWKCSRLNQALMELGALVCTPAQPKCPLCPVRALCVARHTGQVEVLPNHGPRRALRPRRFAAFVVEKRARFLVRQRPGGVVNAQLWEFPNIERPTHCSALKQAARSALRFAPATLHPLCVIKHTITRYRITLEVFRATLEGKPASGRNGQWLTWDQLNQLPFTSAHRKLLNMLKTPVALNTALKKTVKSLLT